MRVITCTCGRSQLLCTADAGCLFLIFLPVIGVFDFRRWFTSGAYQENNYEISATDERARSGTLSLDDNDRNGL